MSARATNWRRVPIKSVYQGLYDGPHATPKLCDEGPVFLGIKNVTDDGQLNLSDIRHISESEFPKWTKRVLPQEGDIVFTYEATLNRYAIIPKGFRGCLGRRMALIRPNPNKVETRFLFHSFFSTDWRQTISKNILSGATVDRIPLTKFPEFEINLPSLETQRKIATILSAYDDLIKNNTRRIKILEEMAQTIYREWFVNFRFPGHEQIKMVDSSLGLIPEGWEVVALSDLCFIVMGQSPKSEFYNDNGEGPPFHQGVSDYGDRFPVDRIFCTIENRVAEAGDVLFSVRAPVGRLNISTKKIVIGRGLCAIRSKREEQVFIFQQLIDQFREVDSMGGGTIFKSVTKQDVYGIKMISPERVVVKKFEAFAKPMFREIEILTSKNSNLRQTRDLLLPKLISGVVDVSDLEIEIDEKEASR